MVHLMEKTGTRQSNTRQCIDDCMECYRLCAETLTHCFEKGDEHTERQHVLLMQDCALLCKVSADLMLRGSSFSAELCKLTAEVCRKCEQSCREFKGDAEMQKCAEICKRCAESCDQMAMAHY